jgi:hypothetical protein
MGMVGLFQFAQRMLQLFLAKMEHEWPAPAAPAVAPAGNTRCYDRAAKLTTGLRQDDRGCPGEDVIAGEEPGLRGK